MAQKRYSLKRLCDLWIVWLDENNIHAQELYNHFNLEGSFIVWLEKREKEISNDKKPPVSTHLNLTFDVPLNKTEFKNKGNK